MRYVVIICLMLIGTVAVAGLEWKTTTQEVTVHPLQASATLEFGFTNTGDEPVTILELKPDCGCLLGKVDKQTIEPGESGTVRVTFDLQGRVGDQRKGIAVATDDHPDKPIKLYVSTTIPKVYAISPERLTWVGGQREPQSFSLVNVSKTPYRLEKAVSSQNGISIELKPMREGFEYELIVTPDPKLGKTLVPIIIYPEKPEGMDEVRTFTVYALVI